MQNKVSFSIKNNIPKIRQQLDKEFEKALLKSAIRVHREVTTLLSGQGQGRRYKVPATNRTWQASKPYDPPATRLGHLRASYKYLVKGTGMTAKGYVGTPLPYSHWLEYGTFKMKPRPHLKRAFKNSKPDIYRYFGGLLR